MLHDGMCPPKCSIGRRTTRTSSETLLVPLRAFLGGCVITAFLVLWLYLSPKKRLRVLRKIGEDNAPVASSALRGVQSGAIIANSAIFYFDTTYKSHAWWGDPSKKVLCSLTGGDKTIFNCLCESVLLLLSVF